MIISLDYYIDIDSGAITRTSLNPSYLKRVQKNTVYF